MITTVSKSYNGRYTARCYYGADGQWCYGFGNSAREAYAEADRNARNMLKYGYIHVGHNIGLTGIRRTAEKVAARKAAAQRLVHFA